MDRVGRWSDDPQPLDMYYVPGNKDKKGSLQKADHLMLERVRNAEQRRDRYYEMMREAQQDMDLRKYLEDKISRVVIPKKITNGIVAYFPEFTVNSDVPVILV